MISSTEARVVAIDAAIVYVATRDHIAAFRRDALPPQWWRHLRNAGVNGRVAALVTGNGVPAETPLDAVPALAWPTEVPVQ